MGDEPKPGISWVTRDKMPRHETEYYCSQNKAKHQKRENCTNKMFSDDILLYSQIESCLVITRGASSCTRWE